MSSSAVAQSGGKSSADISIERGGVGVGIGATAIVEVVVVVDC